ncbi:MAG: hypothetical protein IJB76_01730 [Clostridia bacterium]|nr:hypothetical protein [Clostridia bacterium]
MELFAKKAFLLTATVILPKITLDRVKYKNGELLKAIESIRTNFSTSYVYNDDKMWQITEDKYLHELCIFFDGCPVGIRTYDHVGKLNGEYVSYESGFTYDIFVLDNETAEIISEYV